jgi:hypothetical protein
VTEYIDRTGEPDDVFEREVLARVEVPVTATTPADEQSVDLTPGDVWTEQQLWVVRDLAARLHRAEAAALAAQLSVDAETLRREVEAIIDELEPHPAVTFSAWAIVMRLRAALDAR